MVRAVADTHAAIWYIYNDPRLSTRARALIEQAATDGNQVGISSITFAEIVYLTEKARIAQGVFERLVTALAEANAVLVEIPFDYHVAGTMREVNRAMVPDVPGRVIAATALQAGVPMISRDGKIRLSTIQTIW